jgi:phage terminase small subunit
MTARQRKFVDALLADFPRCSATAAARAAGYTFPGKQGPRLTTYPELAAIIETEVSRRIEELTGIDPSTFARPSTTQSISQR